MSWAHESVTVDGAELHYVHERSGFRLLLVHG